MYNLLFRALVVLMLAIAINDIRAQDNSNCCSLSKVKIGLNYHLQLSHLDIAPVIVIPFSEKLHAGGGLNYLYYYRNSIRTNTSTIGFNLFTRIFPHKNIFTHLEYMYSNVAYRNEYVYEYSRVYIASLFAGGGYRQPFTDKLDGYLYLLADLTHRPESPYKNLLVLKAGITF
ncbi:MAG: hypothetical protein ACK40G_11930 [Cytophagaceae bacterium]